MSQFFSETPESKLIKRGKKERISYVSKLTGKWRTMGTSSLLIAQAKQRKWDEEARVSETGEISVDKTWESWRDDYFATYSVLKAEVSFTKLKIYVRRFEEIVQPTKLVGITPQKVELWMISRLQLVKPQTVETEIKYLAPMFVKAHQRGLIKMNPFADIKLPRFARTERVPLQVEQMDRLLDAVEQHEPHRSLMVRFLYETGMRLDEGLHQLLENIDFAQGIAKVLPHNKKSCVCYQCKKRPGWIGKAGVPREVPLSVEMTAALLKIFQERKTGCVFPMAHTTVNGDHGIIKRSAKRAGLTVNVHPHLFRHSFTTDCERAGVRRTVFMKIVGHKKRDTTDTYSHADIGELHEGLQQLLDWRQEQRTKIKKKVVGGFQVIEAQA